MTQPHDRPLRRTHRFAPWIAGLAAPALAMAASLGLSSDSGDSPTPRELGAVRWERSLDAGLARSRASGRPVFLLFQEVPGCATCVGFGETALSHPLVVEAIETAFVPVAIFNNAGGADAAALARFGEPAWNNPVVRFVDADGEDWIPRRDRIYHTKQLAPRMQDALRAAGSPIPSYLTWLAHDASRDSAARATFGMHCFWEGEACLGADPAVIATRASWQNGGEVVEVWYDPARSSYRSLLERVAARGCSDRVLAATDAEERIARDVFGRDVQHAKGRARVASASDQKRHLRAHALAGLHLTAYQEMRINAALAVGGDPSIWLSPRQRASAGR